MTLLLKDVRKALGHEKILLKFLNALKTPEIFVDLFLIHVGKICVVLVRSSPA